MRVEIHGLREFGSADEMRAFYSALHWRLASVTPPPRRPLAINRAALRPAPPLAPRCHMPRHPMHVIIEHVARHYRLARQDMLTLGRKPRVVLARCVAAYLGRDLLGLSTLRLGKFLGRDPSTIRHGLLVVESRLRRDSTFEILLIRLRDQLLLEE